MEIKKKTWPEYFELIKRGKKRFELRLADFEIKEGDRLILEEYNPKTRTYTGRKITKEIGNVTKINPARMHTSEEIERYGFYVIEIK